MHLSPLSHIDHTTPAHQAFILERFGDRTAFFIETVELPPNLPGLACDLHGPQTGEPPVSEAEVVYQPRGTRAWSSRTCQRPALTVRMMTVIGGVHEGECILFTAYGGPCAPKELQDPTLRAEDREASVAFWAEHALSHR